VRSEGALARLWDRVKALSLAWKIAIAAVAVLAIASLPLVAGLRELLRDLREPYDGHDVVLAHVAVVQLAQEPHHLVDPPDLRVVVLDLAR
jgi:hypothetical protein